MSVFIFFIYFFSIFEDCLCASQNVNKKLLPILFIVKNNNQKAYKTDLIQNTFKIVH